MVSGLATVTLRWEVFHTFQVAVDNVEEAQAAATNEWRDLIGCQTYNGQTPAMLDTDEGDAVPTWEPTDAVHVSWDPITEVKS